MDPRNETVSTIDTGWGIGRYRGASPEVLYYLHCLERVQLQMVLTAPVDQLFHVMSVSRLIAVLDQTSDCVLRILLEFVGEHNFCLQIHFEGYHESVVNIVS